MNPAATSAPGPTFLNFRTSVEPIPSPFSRISLSEISALRPADAGLRLTHSYPRRHPCESASAEDCFTLAEQSLRTHACNGGMPLPPGKARTRALSAFSPFSHGKAHLANHHL